MGQKPHQLVFGVGAPAPRPPLSLQRSARHQHAGVQLHLIGQKARVFHQLAEIIAIGFGSGPLQVGHEVGVDFESEAGQQGEGAGNGAIVLDTVVGGGHDGVQGLDAHLHLCATEGAQLGEGFGAYQGGARFHYQSHAAAAGGFVGSLGGEKLLPGGGLGGSCRAPAVGHGIA